MREDGHTLLHFSDPMLDWELFWGAPASRRSPRMAWIEFSDYAVVLQAAMNGEGIALGWVTAVSRALCEGQLVAASERCVRTGRFYHLCAPHTRPLREVVLAIRDWLIAQMQADLARLGPIMSSPPSRGGAREAPRRTHGLVDASPPASPALRAEKGGLP